MQKLYTDFADVIATVVEKYKGVEKLSKRSEDFSGVACAYSDVYNGVGCPIGALIEDKKITKLLDNFPYGVGLSPLYETYTIIQDKPDYLYLTPENQAALKHLFTEVFDLEQIMIEDLISLQYIHDNEKTVDSFIEAITQA